MGKFVVKETKTGIKFDLKAGNGEVILSSEVYKSEAACMKGVASVMKNSVGEIEDLTVEPVETKKHPKFQIYLDKKGEYRFRLKATNGQIIGTGEGYKARAGVENGIASIKKNAPEAKIEKDF